MSTRDLRKPCSIFYTISNLKSSKVPLDVLKSAGTFISKLLEQARRHVDRSTNTNWTHVLDCGSGSLSSPQDFDLSSTVAAWF